MDVDDEVDKQVDKDVDEEESEGLEANQGVQRRWKQHGLVYSQRWLTIAGAC